jgi:thioredoxin 1
VDFFEPWCRPCNLLAPLLEKLAPDYEGRVVFAKANLEAHPALTLRFEISALPTLVLFEGGEPVKKVVGLQSEEALRRWLDG